MVVLSDLGSHAETVVDVCMLDDFVLVFGVYFPDWIYSTRSGVAKRTGQ